MEKFLIFYNPNECENLNAGKIPVKELDTWLKDGSLEAGDEIYEVKLLYTVVEERKLLLKKPKGG